MFTTKQTHPANDEAYRKEKTRADTFSFLFKAKEIPKAIKKDAKKIA
jgi:hypothetical protein